MKITHKSIIMASALCLILLQGCATDKILVKDSLQSLSKIDVVRYKTPDMAVHTFGGSLLIPLVGIFVAEALPDPEAENAEKALPDYGFLVMQRFTERAQHEIQHLPPITMRQQPVADGYIDQNALIEIKINRVLYAFVVGLRSESTITMKDSGGKVLWKKSFTYLSSDFNRKKSFEELKADNYKLLQEELQFAADTTVNDFIDHLKNGGTN